jgi:hypothetical protein
MLFVCGSEPENKLVVLLSAVLKVTLTKEQQGQQVA